MLLVHRALLEQVWEAQSAEDLHESLQLAIKLEHSTIPPYLTAIFSLKPGTNENIRQVINSVVMEEMLHMSIACNILNALGGSPAINAKDFIPSYPGPLPMDIGEGLRVGLEKYSKDQVKVFMGIEEPKIPLDIPDMKVESAVEDYDTIGDFYNALKSKILDLPEDRLPGDPKHQLVSHFFADDELFPIITKEDAARAIDIIVEQGEGTSTSPADAEGEIAHYYRFEELYKGRKIVKDPNSPIGYSFSNEVVPFDEDGVYNLFPNTKTNMLPPGSEARQAMEDFNLAYARLLNGLHRTFNGEPDFFPNTIGVMYDLKLTAEKLCAMEFPGKKGFTIAPSFEFARPGNS
jgi:hypothetical protein